MEDVRYSNREIDEKWVDIANSLSRIEIQTTTTNGRVKELELSRARQDGFNKAMAIASSVGWTAAMAVIGWMLIQLTNIPDRVNQSVSTALSQYNIIGK